MAQYIEKDRIEEILRRLWKQDDGSNPEHRICYNKALQEVQCKLDTLEVKEVDLDKEFDRYCENLYVIDIQEAPFTEMYDCAKYFFELGINARKGE